MGFKEVPFSAYTQRERHVLLTWILTDDVKFDSLIKVVYLLAFSNVVSIYFFQNPCLHTQQAYYILL